MKIIAFITERESLRPLLEHIGEDADPPPLSSARGPPQAELDLDQTSGAGDEQDIDPSAGLPEDHWARGGRRVTQMGRETPSASVTERLAAKVGSASSEAARGRGRRADCLAEVGAQSR